MKMEFRYLLVIGALALIELAGCSSATNPTRGATIADDEVVPLDTPSGITIQQLAGGEMSRRALGTTVYADANGRTLYTSSADEMGKSNCKGECAKLWIPAAAATKTPSSDWSVIRRSDGIKQWALFGQPLYTYAKDSKIGEATGATDENRNWEVAEYRLLDMPRPKQVAVRAVPDAFGQVLVNWEGRTLYVFLGGDPEQDATACSGGKEDCRLHWTPLAAPVLADRIGEFSVLRRRDGIAQWAYKGRGLYLYDRDVVPELAEGRSVDPLFRIAMIRRTFVPSEVSVRAFPAISAILTTSQGMSLYRRVPGSLQSGTYYLLGSNSYSPSYGYALGLSGCTSLCEKDWTPLKASSDAQSTGYWYVVESSNGSRVWAYRGSVLYSYLRDSVPGQYVGDGQYDVLFSRDPNVEAMVPGTSRRGKPPTNGVLTWVRAQSW